MNHLNIAIPDRMMTSKQIADLVGSRHDSVKRTIETLFYKHIISYTQSVDGIKSANGVIERIYRINERDSYVVVAQLCPAETAKLVDYWMATKHLVVPAPVLPIDYIQALEHLLIAKKAEHLAITERDHAIATKSQISDRKTATALNTASQAVKKAKKLEEALGRCIEHATISAVDKATKSEYEWRPLKNWCKLNDIKPFKVNDERYGSVSSYPAAAWFAVYKVDIVGIFV